MRDKGIFLSFDCGGLGYLSLAAHGHADTLSIALDIGKGHILVDPGTYLYHSGGKWRDYFRSTKAHNTVRVDRLDQSEMIGPFLWGYKADGFLKHCSSNNRYEKACGYHTGYTRLKDPVIHTREVLLDKTSREMVIKDSLSSKKRHFAELFFHLHPDCVLNRLDNHRFEILNRDAVVLIETDSSLCSCVSTGEENPICGWYSQRFGEKTRTSTVCAKGYFVGNVDFITRISVGTKK